MEFHEIHYLLDAKFRNISSIKASRVIDLYISFCGCKLAGTKRTLRLCGIRLQWSPLSSVQLSLLPHPSLAPTWTPGLTSLHQPHKLSCHFSFTSSNLRNLPQQNLCWIYKMKGKSYALEQRVRSSTCSQSWTVQSTFAPSYLPVKHQAASVRSRHYHFLSSYMV